MAYDTARHVTVLFGGSNSALNGETWEWNGTDWTQRFVVGPSPRYGHAMVYDAARGVAVLFGGVTDLAPNGETWEWNGTAWTQRGFTGPSPRYAHAMAYDTARRVSILFGGYTNSGDSNGETWEWNGTLWNQRAVRGPSPRPFHAMAYDAARGITVLFGGNDGGFQSGETWGFGDSCAAPSTTSQLAAQNVCAGSPASFAVGAAGSDPLAYQWRHGTPPVAIPGATSNNYSIAAVTAAHAGQYDCVITNACGSTSTNPAALTVTGAQTDVGPASQIVEAGGLAIFTITASSSSPITYRWRRNGSPLFNSSRFVGASTSTLHISGASLNDAGIYAVALTSGGCSITSDGAALVIHCAADFNGDGGLDPDDLADFISCYFDPNPCPLADYNGDGNSDPDDLSDLISAYFLGC